MSGKAESSFDELFAAAMVLEPTERSRFLDSHCGTDTALSRSST